MNERNHDISIEQQELTTLSRRQLGKPIHHTPPPSVSTPRLWHILIYTLQQKTYPHVLNDIYDNRYRRIDVSMNLKQWLTSRPWYRSTKLL